MGPYYSCLLLVEEAAILFPDKASFEDHDQLRLVSLVDRLLMESCFHFYQLYTKMLFNVCFAGSKMLSQSGFLP